MSIQSTDSVIATENWDKASQFNYPISTQSEQYYRLTLKTPFQLVFKTNGRNTHLLPPARDPDPDSIYLSDPYYSPAKNRKKN